MNDLVSRQVAIDELWKALYEYEDETEQKFQASDELNIDDWFMHRIFVQNMSDIDRQTILALPSADPVKHGKWLKIEGCDTVQCSECFDDFDYIDGLCYLCHGQELPNYCPNCGAMMEWSEE